MREKDDNWEPPAEMEPTMFPGDYSFLSFRLHMHWEDRKVLGRQSVEDVEYAYRVYQMEIKYGALVTRGPLG